MMKSHQVEDTWDLSRDGELVAFPILSCRTGLLPDQSKVGVVQLCFALGKKHKAESRIQLTADSRQLRDVCNYLLALATALESNGAPA